MNRKKAIYRIALISGGLVGIVGGVKTYGLFKTPELKKLDSLQPLVDELAEAIIPASDTPGAKDAKVGAFVTLMLKECTGRKAQNNFIEGLDDLVFHCMNRYGKPFELCNTAQKEAALLHFERKATISNRFISKAKDYLLGQSFFTTLKKYTVLGYCTSNPGATKALRYDHIPGQYKGCIALNNKAAWATQ
ncbi:MAG: gluconate 2-dehydrogenase subunit 3 family protein [Chitinophagales bacterium]|nr:gluconate 2-dehydrogenase subunit 3 family protein [Chitinophagales bacterium]